MTTNVLVVSHDIVGARMAGPGIRYLSLARVLDHHFPTALAAPGEGPTVGEEAVRTIAYGDRDWDSLAPWVDWAEVIVLPGDALVMFPAIEQSGKILVVDLYDPASVEALYLHDQQPNLVREERARDRAGVMVHQCLAGDFFICASEAQRLWWLGVLEAFGRVNPLTFDEDVSLRALIDLVPFGLPPEPCAPKVSDTEVAGVAPEDRVLLWGGGVWEWLDPLTAVRAMPRVLEACPHALLLFPGTRHPNPMVPVAPKVQVLLDMAQELGLAGDRIRFGDWVPHAQWPTYLLRADVGLSLHPKSLESDLAFRTRVLDYIWAGLPSVVTRGDALSDLVSREGLGVSVDPGDVEQVASAVLDLVQRPAPDLAQRFAQVRPSLTWQRAAEPLIAFCEHPRRAPDKVAGGGVGNAYYESRIGHLQAERDELAARVKGYEEGRFIRTMSWLHDMLHRGKSR